MLIKPYCEELIQTIFIKMKLALLRVLFDFIKMPLALLRVLLKSSHKGQLQEL
jgi:hypothetical protein